MQMCAAGCCELWPELVFVLAFWPSRCRLFHNAIFFGSCNIHILNTGCAKILKKIPAPKG